MSLIDSKMMLGGIPVDMHNVVIDRQPNGRVIALDSVKNGEYNNFKEDIDKNDNFRNNAVKRIVTNNEITRLYFSNRNTDNIHASIIREVYRRSGNKYLINRQSNTELHIIMRAIYLQYCKNQGEDIIGQIMELNRIVVNQSVPKIMTQIQQYIGYKHDIEHLPIPIMHPKNLSSKGTRNLPSVTSTF